MTHSTLVLLFGLLLIPGFAMVFVPMLPGFWFLLAVVVLFALIDGFTHVTAGNFALLGVIFALSIIVDWSAGLLGAKLGGAAWKSLLYGVLGGFVGLLILPPLGTFLGLFVGVFLGELLRRRGEGLALRAASGALIGALSGVAINVLLATLFIGLFLFFSIS